MSLFRLFGKTSPRRPLRATRPSRLNLERLEARDVPSVATEFVASAIVHSSEQYVDFVAAEYRRYLNRNADATGLNFFVFQLQNGVSPQVIDAEFVSSNEYVANHGSSSNLYVVGLYHDLLGRAPITTELNFWTNELAVGVSTTQVALDFTTSIERDIQIVRADYAQLLGRNADAAGLNFFVSAMQTGADQFAVASVIIGSSEYVAKHGSNSSSFVTSVYENVLSRTPSTPEATFWVQVINQSGGL